MKRKCELKQVLPVGVIALLASAPHNETVRNVLLAHLKVPVPEELKSYKDIQDWIEFNIEPPKVPLPTLRFPTRRGEEVQVMIIATDREHGSCSYHEDVSGRGNMPISREDILDAAGASEDSQEFFNRVQQQMLDDGVRNNVEMEAVDGSQTYTDHSCDDSDGIEVEIQPEGKTVLKDILRQLDPDRYDELFG